jgi:hypothetical protein
MHSAGSELNETSWRERDAAKSVLKIMQLERACSRQYEIGLVGHGVHMGAARLPPVRRRPLVVDGQVRDAYAAD